MIEVAVEILKKGGVVAAPTETVYGLFADATNDAAVKKIYELKGRPACNPLIAHVSCLEMAKEFAEIDGAKEEIMRHFWGEALASITFVLRKNVLCQKALAISSLVSAGLETIAVRRPQNEIAVEIVEKFGGPLAAPSANRSNCLSPTSAEMVRHDFGEAVELVIDGGACAVGLESTILDISQDPHVLLRHGAVSKDHIESFTGRLVDDSLLLWDGAYEKILAPGMMKKHYAPSLPLRIDADFPLHGEAFVAFGETEIACDLNLSLTADLAEAAHNLFAFLRLVDDPKKYKGIAMMSVPNVGIGVAINDRLKRAAAL